MTALPMTLEDALRHEGYTIDVEEADELTITIDEGTIVVPAMARSVLHWARDGVTPELGDDLYLSKLPIFDERYRPVILSHILDRYRTRRLGYNTPGEWRLAFRRWGNLNMTIPNLRYRSTAVTLPLDDRNSSDITTRTGTVEATGHTLNVGSDFPQSVISDDASYASVANDQRAANNATTADSETASHTGRSQSVMALLAEQRDLNLNVDLEVVDGLDTLFLGIFDQGEGTPGMQYGFPSRYPRTFNW